MKSKVHRVRQAAFRIANMYRRVVKIDAGGVFRTPRMSSRRGVADARMSTSSMLAELAHPSMHVKSTFRGDFAHRHHSRSMAGVGCVNRGGWDDYNWHDNLVVVSGGKNKSVVKIGSGSQK